MPGEGERWTVSCPVCMGEGIGDWGSCLVCGGGGTVEVVPASRLEAAESALTEALDALDKYSTEQGRIIAARIRSQIEGSNE